MALSLRQYWTDLKRSFGATVAASGNSWGGYADYDPDTYSQTTSEAYLKLSPAVYMAVKYRAQKIASVPVKFYKASRSGKRTEVTSGSLIELMTKVNPFWTAARLYEMTEMSLCLRGKSFWALDRGKASRGEPREIWWMHPDKVKVVRGADYISHFEYDPGSGRPIQFAKEEVLWLRYPNPDNEYDGLAPLDAARIIADTGSAALLSNKRMFTQGMQLAGFVSPADRQDTWSKEQGKEIEDSLARRFSGANKAHRWAVLGRQMQFNALTLSPKDIEFTALLKWSFEDICRVFGLSPDLLGGERTYANAAEARLAFWQDTMMPECSFFANELTEQLLPLFGAQADIAEFDLSNVDVLQELEAAKWARWKEQIELGSRTRNEEREAAGLKPLPWGDAWWATISLVPISTAEQAAPPPDEPLVLPEPTVKEADPLALPEGQPRRRTRAIAYGSTEHERAWQAFVRRTEPHEQLVGKTTAALMRSQKRSVLARIENQRGRATRDVAEVANDPFDLPRWVKQFRSGIRPVLTEIVRDAGEAALSDLGLGIAFDVADPNVTKFLIQRAQRFAVEVNETTWTKLKDSLSEGITAGEGIDDLAKRVESVMGDRIRSSSQAIARTETIGASNGGSLLSAKQSGVVRRKSWLAALDDRTRSTHVEAHGQTVGIDEDFQVGGGSGPHPGAIGLAEEDIQCRCTMTFELDVEGED